MAMGCGAGCAKVILIIFNVLFLLTGLALLGVGIWLIANPNSLISKVEILEDLLAADRYLNYAAYVMIAAGAFVVIVSVFGCCGAIQESVCLLSLYIALLVAVMIIELACGILAIVFRQRIISVLEETATCNMYDRKDAICKDKRSTPLNFIKAFRFIQVQFKCCGVKNATDYNIDNVIYPGNQAKVSWSCCILENGDYNGIMKKFNDTDETPISTTATDYANHFKDLDKCRNSVGGYYHKKGCSQSIRDWLEKYAPILIGLAIGLAAFELFVIIFAVCLCRNTSAKDD